MSVKRYQPVAQCVEPSYQAQMIEPKVMEFSEGEYVRWEDYDATCETLAHTETERDASDAEVERLKAELDRVTSQNGYHNPGIAVSMLREELARRMKDHFEIRKGHEATVQMVHDLKAEVERLRKAGDAMADEIQKHLTYNDGLEKTNDWWNAAKEGKQS